MTASAPEHFPSMYELRAMERNFQRGAYLSKLVLDSMSNIGYGDARPVRQFDLPADGERFDGLSLGTLRTTHDYPAHIALRLPQLPAGYFQVDGLLEPLNPTIGVRMVGAHAEGESAYQLALLYHCFVDYGISPQSIFELQLQLNSSLFRQLLRVMDPPSNGVVIPPEPLRSHPELFRMATFELEREIANDPNRHVIRQMMRGNPTSA